MTATPELLAASGLLVSGGLLAAAGVAKVVRPDGTARALQQAGLPGRPVVVRVGAALEVAVGTVAVALGGPVPALLVAASYLGFAAFVATAIRRGWSLSSCGCFGEPDVPPTRLHVVADLAVAAVAAAAAAGDVHPATVIAQHPAQGVLLCAMSALIAGMVYLLLSRLPRLQVS